MSSIRFTFLIPEVSGAFGIARIGSSDYFIVKLKSYGYESNQWYRLLERIRELHIPIGGRELRSINIPRFTDIQDTIRNIIREEILKIFRKSRKKRIPPISPEYFVLAIDRYDRSRLLVILDLEHLPDEAEDIPVAWGHRTQSGGLPETYCIVIGYRDVFRIMSSQPVRERCSIIEDIVCPLVKVFRDAANKNNIQHHMTDICKNVHRCTNSSRGGDKLYGTDILSYILDTRTAIKYGAKIKSTEEDEPPKTLTQTIILSTHRSVDITLSLWGFKLAFRRYPQTYLGAFKYHKNFILESSINDTKAIVFTVDTRWMLAHYYWSLLNDPYLEAVTALKYLLLTKSRGYIPHPWTTTFVDPYLSISKIRETMRKYIDNPDLLFNDLKNTIQRIRSLTLNDRRLLKYLETIAFHTFIHTLYYTVLEAFNITSDDMGIIIEKVYRPIRGDTSNEYPFDHILDPRHFTYRVIFYEKGDGGLGYIDIEPYTLIHHVIIPKIPKIREMFKKLDDKIIIDRIDMYNTYYSDVKNKLLALKSAQVNKYVDSLEKLQEKLLSLGINNYTLLPGWIVRYGLDTSLINKDKRREAENLIWLFLDTLFDLYWDVSPNDLVIKYECVYYDLIQYFTLSRRYAEILISDIERTVKKGSVISDFLVKFAGIIYQDSSLRGRIHAFYTPWIDDDGRRAILEASENPQTREIYVVLRDPSSIERLRGLTGKVKIITLDKVFNAPLHSKLYANDSGTAIITSTNLIGTSLSRNIEGYALLRGEYYYSKALLGITKIIYNTYRLNLKEETG